MCLVGIYCTNWLKNNNKKADPPNQKCKKSTLKTSYWNFQHTTRLVRNLLDNFVKKLCNLIDFLSALEQKMARKSWDLLHRSCWVTPQIHTWRTSPRMEVRQIQWYILTFDRRLHSRGKVQIFCEGQCTLGVNIADSDIRKNHLTWNFGSGIKFWFCAFFSALIRGVYLCLIFEMSICEFITNSKKKSISNQTWFFFRVRTWFLLPV